MGVFAKIKGKRASQGGNYIKPGNHKLKIKQLKLTDSQVKQNKVYFIAENVVIESDVHKPGEEVSMVVDMTGDYPDMSLGQVNDFLYKAACSMAAEQGDELPEEDVVDEDFAKEAVGEDNPFMGVVLDCYGFEKQNKDKSGVYTRYKWSVPEEFLDTKAA